MSDKGGKEREMGGKKRGKKREEKEWRGKNSADATP